MSYNIALLVACIAGALGLDTIISAVYLKKATEALSEAVIVILLGVIAKLLTLEGAAKTYLERNFVFWCILLLALTVVIAILWIHITKIINKHDRRNRKKNKNPKPSKTPANKKKEDK